MKYKLWDVIDDCWYDRGDVYLDEEGQLFCIEELGGYTPYMNKENVTARYEIVKFTGLKDRNGKEIYEGDIIQTTTAGDIYQDVVKWSDKDATWMFDSTQGLCTVRWDDIGGDTAEIIGNIYKNPELMEETK